ncbi:TPA: hypothetical protein N0F65_007813 [Lagenidium giganteum]|uniref:Uncharacterized protein n=1 Tax=Lagenidium giganteum TaxID=4803 RepID=A0AAV2YZS4_9STRA|nr:TPA: hypothetical protein N0F65_007813 [Lagenidium giganteum]
MPANIQGLSNLVGLKLDIVSLVEWGDDAALTDTHHPKLQFLFLVRFNATAIPPGMLSPDFPKFLNDIEFCVTTLPELPPTLPTLWPEYMWLYVDYANWTMIPDVMLEMKLSFLRLEYNHIHDVPPELFTKSSASFIALSGNPISELPEVDMRPALDLLLIDTTNISTLPSWLDPSQTKVVVGRTPFCSISEHQRMTTANGQTLCSYDPTCRQLHLGTY